MQICFKMQMMSSLNWEVTLHLLLLLNNNNLGHNFLLCNVKAMLHSHPTSKSWTVLPLCLLLTLVDYNTDAQMAIQAYL